MSMMEDEQNMEGVGTDEGRKRKDEFMEKMKTVTMLRNGRNDEETFRNIQKDHTTICCDQNDSEDIVKRAVLDVNTLKLVVDAIERMEELARIDPELQKEFNEMCTDRLLKAHLVGLREFVQDDVECLRDKAWEIDSVYREILHRHSSSLQNMLTSSTS